MKPNILLLFPDQWRADWLEGLNEEIPLRTPHLKKLMERGFLCTGALSSSPLCAPARAALATGRRYHNCGVRDNSDNLPLNAPTFYRGLRESGYSVLGCGKFDLHKPAFIWGRDGKNLLNDWGFTNGIDSEGKIDGVAAYRQNTAGPYLTHLENIGMAEDYVNNMEERGSTGISPSILNQKEYSDDWVCDNALSLLEDSTPGKPWFLQVNFPGPHLPFDITEGMSRLYADENFPLPHDSEDSRDHLQIRRCYAAMMENIDTQAGRIREKIKERGELGNTMIIFASDHGEMLGERKHYGKCYPYNSSVNIPLIMAGPGVQEGGSNDSVIELIDLSATILEAAGIPLREETDARSLWPLLKGDSDSVRQYGVSSLSSPDHAGVDWRMVKDRDFKLIEWKDGRTELYSRKDEYERENLIRTEAERAEILYQQLPPWFMTYNFEKPNEERTS